MKWLQLVYVDWWIDYYYRRKRGCCHWKDNTDDGDDGGLILDDLGNRENKDVARKVKDYWIFRYHFLQEGC